MRKWLAFALAWLVVLGGAFLAGRVQTDGGRVAVSEVRIPAEDGVTVSGLLYRPRGATAATPAPGVLVSHGYINTREMQSPFAIELSRRGYVVLAMDMTGHGYSGGIVGTAGFGGPAALRYLKGLPFVDRAAIGLEGHSMGGGPVMAAALSDPDGYRAIVLEGSTPGLLGAPAPETPRNLAVVFGQYDEFAGLMWGVPKGSDVARSPKLAKVFGVAGPVEEGKLYGSIADGTARILANPPITHPWEHFSNAGVGDAVDWFQRTIPPPNAMSPADQVWLLKEVGTLIAFVGLVGLIVTTFDVLLGLPVFAALNQPARPATGRRNGRWWLSLVITAALPALTYFPLMKVGQLFFPMAPFPQWVQNQLLVWALGTALISLLIGLVLRSRPAFTNRWGLSMLAALATMAVAYASILVIDAAFKVDYRFWVLGLKPLDAARSLQLPGYLILWSLFFLVAIRGLAANIAVEGEGMLAAISWGKVAMAAGFGVLVIWEYATLFSTGLLGTPTEPLNTVIAIQFVPLLGVIGIIGAWTYRRTNSYVPGALICALLISWYVTSGTANHWQPGFEPALPGAPAAKR
ncbi:alpha/beta fold hydrolase [Phenylobacterium sp.]|uniref:alpha/beta hydrolase n=1 Tax=Phenylobacterium sp. TaxID=1871053 RepID=UPI0025FB1B25|nr:alpha/beta fold hydrolase [Phenylobacterium sp.]MBX3485695.1 alpha/beta hydrolase [Phenylobacterium sp.]MCW5759491.1 alpha/beta hydrolase [Phenylobacterium sp.]